MNKLFTKLPSYLVLQFPLFLIIFLTLSIYQVFAFPNSDASFKNNKLSVQDDMRVLGATFNKSEFDVENLDNESQKLLKFLRSYGSPIAEAKYAKIIVETSAQNGADYRLNVGIMLSESGLCKIPLKKYNCYGYMNGVQYESFEEALEDITRKVSKQYTSRFGYNIDGMGKAYGAHNVEAWRNRVLYAVNHIEK